MTAWYDVVGLVGVAGILLAYAGLQTGRLDADRPPYSILNGVGAALVLLSLVYDFNLSAFVIEACWVLISLYGLARSLRRRPPPDHPRTAGKQT